MFYIGTYGGIFTIAEVNRSLNANNITMKQK